MRPSSAFGGAEEQTLVDSQSGSGDIEIICVYILCDIVTLCDIESICVRTLCLHIESMMN